MRLQHRGLIIASAIGSFICGGSLYASPYISLYQMHQALERNDLQSFSGHVDFPALRESIKTNLRTIVAEETAQQNNPLLNMVGSVVNGFVLDPVVDSMVTPSGVAALLKGQQLQLGERGEPVHFSQKANAVEVRTGYESLNQFAVSIKPKGEATAPVTLLLSRDGLLSWKVSGVRLPENSLSLVKGMLPKSAMPDLKDLGGSASEFLEGLL
jgi:hypothetical protein